MLRTMWFALTCLAGLGAMIAIKVAMTTEQAMHDQAAAAIVSNVAAKSDRLPLSDFRWAPHTDRAPPVAPTTPVHAASTPAISRNQESAEATDEPPRKPAATPSGKTPHRRWQDANAKLVADPPPRPRDRATTEPQKTTADSDRATTTSHVFKCRQDNLGSLLRALDLSPHCSS